MYLHIQTTNYGKNVKERCRRVNTTTILKFIASPYAKGKLQAMLYTFFSIANNIYRNKHVLSVLSCLGKNILPLVTKMTNKLGYCLILPELTLETIKERSNKV